MTSALPRRLAPPWLPPLLGLVRDDPDWEYRDDSFPVPGRARLRVWDAGEAGGHFAVVTETGYGVSVTNGARVIWQALLAEYGEPLGLAEYWPEDECGSAHVDLVVPPGSGKGVSWLRLWPEPAGPHSVFRTAWWDRFGLQITAG